MDDFVVTVDRFGGQVDPATVAEQLQARIDAIASQIGVTRQAVLRTYIPDEWGQQMATAMMAGRRGHDAAVVEGPDEHFAIRVVARLLAALGRRCCSRPSTRTTFGRSHRWTRGWLRRRLPG